MSKDIDIITQGAIDNLLDSSLGDLMMQADKVRQQYCGSKLHLCSIINAKSGLCSEDCKFCAQSAQSNAIVDVYPLKTKEEIVKVAQHAKALGADNFGIVTSGNKLNVRELNIIAKATARIKDELGIGVCGSLGALDKPAMKLLKEAGLSRYHHNIETSRRFYPQIVSSHSFEERLRTIRYAKETGLEVCSGGIIGMGETMADRIDMACTLRELGVDSVPLNILIAMKGTALETIEPITPEEVLKTICIFRIILQDKELKIAAGREKSLQNAQVKGFMAGANGMITGGYLTVKGNVPEKDSELIKEIHKAWQS